MMEEKTSRWLEVVLQFLPSGPFSRPGAATLRRALDPETGGGKSARGLCQEYVWPVGASLAELQTCGLLQLSRTVPPPLSVRRSWPAYGLRVFIEKTLRQSSLKFNFIFSRSMRELLKN